jgi:aminopeptidase N
MRKSALFALLFMSASACRSASVDARPVPLLPVDEHSFAEPNRVRVMHVDLDLAVDFERQVVAGTAALDLARPDPMAPLVLDQANLEIRRVTAEDGSEREFRIGPEQERFGAPLMVDLWPGDERVRVEYATRTGSEALQWLAPAQTAGKAEPFLYTQGQAILTRSWIPLQDSPGVRVTYSAKVRVPIGLTAVMSAEHLGQDPDGAYHFRMQEPIPCYLIALAVGDLASRAISERSAVWAEPSVVERAQCELVDTERMIAAAEELFGPYRWGRYDLLVLPPSFPYGGMENPRLTFATPTILAGDRSLVSLVAHELAHSWSGNLVTNATWRDFWLNEGFTTYFQGRIMEEVYGKERADMELELAASELKAELASLEPRDQVLHIDLAGRHPDDGQSLVAYDKGALFLVRLEQVFGRKVFDRFLRGWFDGHAFQSVTTADFVATLQARLLERAPELAQQIDVERWLFESGLPDDAPIPRSRSLAEVDATIEQWKAGRSPGELATKGWSTQQWLRFLRGLPALAPEQMTTLDAAFGFLQSGNSEIVCQWLQLAIRYGYSRADARLEEFLMTVGRRKFLRPLYEELAKTPAGLERARALYARARPGYHAVSSVTLDKILELAH